MYSIHLHRLDLTDADELWALAEAYPYKPYWFVGAVSRHSQMLLLQRELGPLLSSLRSAIFGVRDGPALLGACSLRRLDWDSEHFGFGVGRLEHIMVHAGIRSRTVRERLARGALAAARELGLRSVHTWIALDDIETIQVLEQSGFYLTDASVTYVFDVQSQPLVGYGGPLKLRSWQDGDQRAIVNLASHAFWQDRFHCDPHLAAGQCDKLHSEWLRNSLYGQAADHVIVAEMEGTVIGFVTCKLIDDHDGLLEPRIGVLVLAAVSPGSRGLGCYTAMIYEGFAWFANEDKARWILGGTQVNNVAVQRMWSHAGAQLVRTGVSLHSWLD